MAIFSSSLYLHVDTSMAEPLTQPTDSNEPEPRFGPATFTIGSDLYVFRGYLKSFQHKTTVQFPQEVEVFSGRALSWKTAKSDGELPSWFRGAAVTTFQQKAFFFGGDRGGAAGFCNDVFSLDSKSFSWKQLVSNDQMLRTVNSGLVSLSNGALLTSGGYAERPTYQPTSKFIPNPEDSAGGGWTNQLLHYSTVSGECMDFQCNHRDTLITTSPQPA